MTAISPVRGIKGYFFGEKGVFRHPIVHNFLRYCRALERGHIWKVKYSQRHSNTFFRKVLELTIEWHNALRYIMDYIYKTELDLSNIRGARQLSK